MGAFSALLGELDKLDPANGNPTSPSSRPPSRRVGSTAGEWVKANGDDSLAV